MIFRNFILQNFPFLEDDFDALTDYELFCKMVEYASNPENIKAYLKEYIDEKISDLKVIGTYNESTETLTLSLGGNNG